MRVYFLLIGLFILNAAFAQSPESPKIHGADVYGSRPDRPFLYKIPATGAAPLNFRVLQLPAGLKLDAATGIIDGTVKESGSYPVSLIAQNTYGADTLHFEIQIGDQIALTPAMGWNSWNVFGLRVTDRDIRNAADVMVSSGLINHGWSYINIDDGWEAPERGANGEILPNSKFPDMLQLSDYLHSKGLKFGIYSSPGPKTCGGYLGSYQHEEQDVHTYEKWGIDYLKYDWCSYTRVSGLKDLFVEAKSKLPYQKISPFLLHASRNILFSICQYGFGKVEQWGKDVGGNSWRTTGDITDTWASVKKILKKQEKLAPYAGPGHWNDPDMLVLGVVGWNTDSRKCRLSEDEQRLHFGMWCMLSAPLMLGCDLTKIDPFTMSLITNDQLIALNQDKAGKQAELIKKKGKIQVWRKELSGGAVAIAILNLGNKSKAYTITKDIAGSGRNYFINLLSGREEGLFSGLKPVVPAHGIVIYKAEQ